MTKQELEMEEDYARAYAFEETIEYKFMEEINNQLEERSIDAEIVIDSFFTYELEIELEGNTRIYITLNSEDSCDLILMVGIDEISRVRLNLISLVNTIVMIDALNGDK